MKREPPVSLPVIRAKQQPPHVTITIEVWSLGNIGPGGLERFYWEPMTTTRIGDITRPQWQTMGHILASYGRELYNFKRPTRKVCRRVKGRKGRR